MSKPRGILWLEEQTGQTLEPPEETPSATKGRHVSIRVSDELHSQLEAAAAINSESVSQTAPMQKPRSTTQSTRSPRPRPNCPPERSLPESTNGNTING